MEYIFFILIGVLIGIIIGTFMFAVSMVKATSGMLKMMYDGDESYLFLDLDKYPEEIMQKKYVVFKVEQKHISHK